MITISKPKLLALAIIGLFLFPPIISSAHGLYQVTLPTNTLFADDFNEYTTGTDLGNGYGTGVNGCPTTGGTANQCYGKQGGWGWYDNAVGGYRHASNNASYSAPISLEMASSTISGAKFDIHHMIPTSNSTTTVTLSAFFAFDNFTRNGSGGNNEFTFSLESWTYTAHRECIAAIFPAAAVVEIVTTDSGSMPSGGLATLRLAAIDDTRMISATATWHHISMTCNLKDFTYRNLIVDNWDILKQVDVGFNGFPHWDTSGDTEMLVGTAPFTIPLRFEMALLTNPTSGIHVWHKWADDIVVTDDTPGQPNIIQFGIVTASGLFQLILITTAMMYVSSGFGAVMRVFAKDKVPKFLGPKFIIVTGVVGTAGFLFMLIVGANLVQPACPPHYTCVG